MITGFRIKEQDNAFLLWVEKSNKRTNYFVSLHVYLIEDLLILDSKPLVMDTSPFFACFALACLLFQWMTAFWILLGISLLLYALQSKLLYWASIWFALRKVHSKTQIGWT
jgi:hypothetical protein